MPREYINLKVAAEILEVSESTIRYYLKQGYISAKNNNRSIIDKESVLAFAREVLPTYIDIKSIKAKLNEEYDREKNELASISKFVESIKALNVISFLKSIYETVLQGCYEREYEMVISYLSGKNLAQIASDVGLSRERTRQIIGRAVRRGIVAFKNHSQALQQVDEIDELKQRNILLKQQIDELKQQVDELKQRNFLLGEEQNQIDFNDKFLLNRLSDLDISGRTLNRLNEAEITYVFELCQYSKKALLKFRNFGIHSINELEELLERHGLSLRKISQTNKAIQS